MLRVIKINVWKENLCTSFYFLQKKKNISKPGVNRHRTVCCPSHQPFLNILTSFAESNEMLTECSCLVKVALNVDNANQPMEIK